MISRKQWGATPLTRFTNKIKPSYRTGIVIHHSVTAEGKSLAEVARILKQIEAGHLARNLGGIGYNLAVDFAGRIYEARGINVLGAHTADANARNYGIVFIGDTRKRITDDAVDGLKQAIAMLEKNSKKDLQLFGHGDLRPTACPGPKLNALIESGALAN